MKLPERVRIQHGRYYLLSQATERNAAGRLKRRWVPLTRVDEGPAALYDALATLHREVEHGAPMMPSLVATWRLHELPRYAAKTRTEYHRMSERIAEAYADFAVTQIRPKDVADLVDQWRDKPRTANAYRALVSLILSFAVRRGFIDRNPAAEIAGLPEPQRSRYLTDDELERIRAAASPMLAASIDLALVTCQRIGDLLALRWSDVTETGIVFRPAKVEGSTAIAVPLRMTPRLRAALDAAKAAAPAKVRSVFVLCTSTGQKYSYTGHHSAWQRACDAAAVKNAHFHDLRRRALTDAKRQGLDVRRLGGHSSEKMTARYIEAAGLDWIDPPTAETTRGVDTRAKA